MKNTEKLQELKKMIKNSSSIVFFGGAGVSTESGIKDFRSKDGLYNMKYKYSPEKILSHSFFITNTKEFYIFYKDKMNSLNYNPNITHYTLAKLEKQGKLKAIVTQNIENINKKAGSKIVYELHGSIQKNYCINCQKEYDAEFVFNSKNIVPKCSCGGIIKPDVVLYEEPLDNDIYDKSLQAISNCDMLIIGGTSLAVYPASYLINYFKGKYLVLINKEKTPFDNKATLVINDSLGYVFDYIDKNCI